MGVVGDLEQDVWQKNPSLNLEFERQAEKPLATGTEVNSLE